MIRKIRRRSRRATAIARRLSRLEGKPSTRDEINETRGFSGLSIPPLDTDPSIDNWLDPHYVAAPRDLPQRGKLFLFLCGSYGNPSRQRLIIDFAAAHGFHAVNLTYPNSWTVGGLCARSRDLDAHEKVRMEILDGQARSDLLRQPIGESNSIYNRIRRLLQHLATEYEDAGWSQYLLDDQVAWAAVVTAGHSQGGGHAALLAKRHLVDRVVMFASPADRSRQHRTPAPWLSAEGVTPPDRYFGFVHLEDGGIRKIRAAWRLLGLDGGGAAVDVDEAAPPYGGSQRLVTSASDIRRGKYHACVVHDGVTPQNLDGSPQYGPVWEYLLGTSNRGPQQSGDR